MTSTGPWPPAMLRLLADLSAAFDASFDANADVLVDYTIGLTVTSHSDHVATLYEEGWDFTAPEKTS